MKIEGYMTGEKGDPRPLARHLAEKCTAFFEEAENRKAFEEWKKKREEAQESG